MMFKTRIAQLLAGALTEEGIDAEEIGYCWKYRQTLPWEITPCPVLGLPRG